MPNFSWKQISRSQRIFKRFVWYARVFTNIQLVEIVASIRGKLSLEDAFEKKSEHVQTLKISGNGQVRNDAVMALTALGYSSAESLKAVSAVEITEEMDVEAVLKAALKHMSLL